MASETADKLAAMSLKDVQTVSHGPCNNMPEWKAQLETVKKGLPEHYALTKTLVFKPKTPKSQTAVLIMVVALEDSDTNSSLIAKALDVKEPRFAQADAVEAALGVKPADASPLAITAENAASVQVAFDLRILDAKVPVGVHPSRSDVTVFIRGADIKAHLDKTGVKITVIDFSLAAVYVSNRNHGTGLSDQDCGRQSASKQVTSKPPIKQAPKQTIEGAELVGITLAKEEDFSGWYQQVLTKGDMLDYYDISGCYILKPWSYGIWERVQQYFDSRIKSMGVQNCYFPMFVSAKVLEREKDHIEGFAPEVAWVTKAGQKDLEEHIAIRPTSETVMYPYYAKWIRSHRDLPLRLNQWNSVVRWEFKHPQPFLRTREFLWQEGHTAHIDYPSADKEVMQILDWYEGVYRDVLAVPVRKGKKTENEKFAGGFYTTTCEGYIPATGRGIQGATSHCLGQNFSKMFNITVEDPKWKEGDPEEAKKLHVWQNSWGLSTRVIGVMVMIHSDNKGLVLPPNAAQIQVVIVPCGITAKTTEAQRKALTDAVLDLEKTLSDGGIRVHADLRDTYSPGYKFNDWELKGVPIRLEYGPKDIEKNQVVAVRRDTGVKESVSLQNIAQELQTRLTTMHQDMFNKAKEAYDSHVKLVKTWDEVVPALDAKNVILMAHCKCQGCEDEVKENSKGRVDTEAPEDSRAPSMGAKSLCIPFDQPDGKDKIVPGVTKCVHCGENAKHYTLFGRSY
ncbi:hypothetical protein FN846DRAFT_783620 [Sphaerosporella brunnea]|uniref:proline--tRNA ligase n=1 Tax=Sphaerosporella brunnea TaxID=1250544 RepID=A0A5J5EN99_9PEZI|nr:hypothetical protein FN846DRAFT_783620 [Sphaerosporella brunnea]